MMKNGLVHRNQRGATVWRPLLIVLCKGEKYRFLTILYEKTCVLNCFFNYLYLVVPNICVNTHTHIATGVSSRVNILIIINTCKGGNSFLRELSALFRIRMPRLTH